MGTKQISGVRQKCTELFGPCHLFYKNQFGAKLKRKQRKEKNTEREIERKRKGPGALDQVHSAAKAHSPPSSSSVATRAVATERRARSLPTHRVALAPWGIRTAPRGLSPSPANPKCLQIPFSRSPVPSPCNRAQPWRGRRRSRGHRHPRAPLRRPRAPSRPPRPLRPRARAPAPLHRRPRIVFYLWTRISPSSNSSPSRPS